MGPVANSTGPTWAQLDANLGPTYFILNPNLVGFVLPFAKGLDRHNEKTDFCFPKIWPQRLISHVSLILTIGWSLLKNQVRC